MINSKRKNSVNDHAAIPTRNNNPTNSPFIINPSNLTNLNQDENFENIYPSLHEANSKSNFFNVSQPDPNRHHLPIVAIAKRTALANFSKKLLIVPLIVFGLISVFAIVAGIVYGVLIYRKNMANSSNSTGTALSNVDLKNISGIAINSTKTTLLSTTLTTILSINPQLGLNSTSQYNDAQSTSNLYANCGYPPIQPNLQQTRIIRGFSSKPHSWPWTVSIGYVGVENSMPHACGGTLINKRTVVTATHCVLKSTIFSLVGNPVPNSDQYKNMEAMLRIYVGVSTRSTDININTTFRATKVHSYPNFNSDTFQNDISLITLDKDVEFSDNVSVICVPTSSNLNPGTDVYAVGWGFTEGNFFKASDTLNQVKIQIQSVDSCGLSYLPVYQFCAGNPLAGKDTCNGDSGGPIMELVNNQWFLVGVVSNGDAACTGRGIYTNVAFYSSWIANNSIVK